MWRRRVVTPLAAPSLAAGAGAAGGRGRRAATPLLRRPARPAGQPAGHGQRVHRARSAAPPRAQTLRASRPQNGRAAPQETLAARTGGSSSVGGRPWRCRRRRSRGSGRGVRLSRRLGCQRGARRREMGGEGRGGEGASLVTRLVTISEPVGIEGAEPALSEQRPPSGDCRSVIKLLTNLCRYGHAGRATVLIQARRGLLPAFYL